LKGAAAGVGVRVVWGFVRRIGRGEVGDRQREHEQGSAGSGTVRGGGA